MLPSTADRTGTTARLCRLLTRQLPIAMVKWHPSRKHYVPEADSTESCSVTSPERSGRGSGRAPQKGRAAAAPPRCVWTRVTRCPAWMSLLGSPDGSLAPLCPTCRKSKSRYAGWRGTVRCIQRHKRERQPCKASKVLRIHSSVSPEPHRNLARCHH